VSGSDPSLTSLFTSEHRRLDGLLGRFLAAAGAADTGSAREAMRAFDDALRRHTALEEERLFLRKPEEKLLPPAQEGERERLFRELALEHVQIRELSGILLRLLEKEDLSSARALIGNLLSRWDAHTAREERDAYPISDSPEGPPCSSA